MNEQYEEDGFLLVRGVFDAAEVQEMRDGIARILETVEGTASDRNHAWVAGASSRGTTTCSTTTPSSRAWSRTRGSSRCSPA